MSSGRFSPLRVPSGDPTSSDPSRIASFNLCDHNQLVEANDCLLLYGPTDAAEVTLFTSANALANEATDGGGGDSNAVTSDEAWTHVGSRSKHVIVNSTKLNITNVKEELPMLLGAPLNKRQTFIDAVNKCDKVGVIALFDDIVVGEWQPDDPIGLVESSFIVISKGSMCCNFRNIKMTTKTENILDDEMIAQTLNAYLLHRYRLACSKSYTADLADRLVAAAVVATSALSDSHNDSDSRWGTSITMWPMQRMPQLQASETERVLRLVALKVYEGLHFFQVELSSESRLYFLYSDCATAIDLEQILTDFGNASHLLYNLPETISSQFTIDHDYNTMTAKKPCFLQFLFKPRGFQNIAFKIVHDMMGKFNVSVGQPESVILSEDFDAGVSRILGRLFLPDIAANLYLRRNGHASLRELAKDTVLRNIASIGAKFKTPSPFLVLRSAGMHALVVNGLSSVVASMEMYGDAGLSVSQLLLGIIDDAFSNHPVDCAGDGAYLDGDPVMFKGKKVFCVNARKEFLKKRGTGDLLGQLPKTLTSNRFPPLPVEGSLRLFHVTSIQHATSILEYGIDFTLGFSTCDFGQRFYTSPNLEYCLDFAVKKYTYPIGTVVGLLVFDIPNTLMTRLRTLHLEGPAWSDVVTANRRSTLLQLRKDNRDLYDANKNADVIKGPITKNATHIENGRPPRETGCFQSAFKESHHLDLLKYVSFLVRFDIPSQWHD